MVLSEAGGGSGRFFLFLITVPVGETQGVQAENSIPQCCKNLNITAAICHHGELIKSFSSFRVNAFHHAANSPLIRLLHN